MSLVDQLAVSTNYKPSKDLISLLGSISDESNAISYNYLYRYLSNIYDLNSYISSKIFNYSSVNTQIYQIILSLTLITPIENTVVIPAYSKCTSDLNVEYITIADLPLDAFSQVLTISVLRARRVTTSLVAKDLINNSGSIILIDYPIANYEMGELIVDGVSYKYSNMAPYTNIDKTYAVIGNPDSTISLVLSTPLLNELTDTSTISITYLVDTSEGATISIDELTFKLQDNTELKFSSIIINSITLGSPKSKAFDFENLITRYDYSKMLSSVPIVNRSIIYSMADLIRGTVKEIDPNHPDVDLIYNGHYVPYYAYFVVELTNYQALDNLTRSFIMNYFSKGLLVQEVLLTYGDNKIYQKSMDGTIYQVSNDGGYTIWSEYKPAHLAFILDSKNQLGNSELTESGLSTPGYRYPDLAVQLVVARYVSVDITVRLATYTDLSAKDLSDTYLGLLSDLRNLLNSDKFGFNSTLVKDDIAQVCWMYEAVQDVRVEDFKYSRVGQLVQEGPIVETSPFELLALGKLNVLFDYRIVVGEDGETLNEKIEALDKQLHLKISLRDLALQTIYASDKLITQILIRPAVESIRMKEAPAEAWSWTTLDRFTANSDTPTIEQKGLISDWYDPRIDHKVDQWLYPSDHAYVTDDHSKAVGLTAFDVKTAKTDYPTVETEGFILDAKGGPKSYSN